MNMMKATRKDTYRRLVRYTYGQNGISHITPQGHVHFSEKESMRQALLTSRKKRYDLQGTTSSPLFLKAVLGANGR